MHIYLLFFFWGENMIFYKTVLNTEKNKIIVTVYKNYKFLLD